MRVLVVDDEPLARERLRRLLGDHPDVRLVAEACDVPTALQALTQHQIDVVFLDIHLPDGDGFDLLELAGPRDRPALICVTADARHAVRAFDAAAVDYLLKPFSRERLADALARVRDHHRAARPRDTAATGPQRIPVPGPTGTRFVDTRAVVVVRAERNYVRLEVADRRVLLRSTLREMEDRLPLGEFVRVNRSMLVRIAVIVELQTLPHGEVSLRLATGELVISGRSYAAPVKAALGL